MMLNYIDPNWTFKEFVENIEVVKFQTKGIIASFSSFEIKKQVEFKRLLRKKIYAFNFETWKKDRILECIYDYLEVEKIKEIAK